MARRFALVALWLVATVVAILMASFAVRLVGDTVVAQGPATVSRGEVEADLSTLPPGSGPGTTAATATTVPPAEPPAGDPQPSPTTATTAPPSVVTASPSPSPSPSSTAAEPVPPTIPTAPTTAPAPAPAPTPTSEQSFALVGGSVRVRCSGAVASLVSSSPNPGFAMEVRSTGPDRIEVRFSADRSTSELRASCRDGQVDAEPKESSSRGGADGGDRGEG